MGLNDIDAEATRQYAGGMPLYMDRHDLSNTTAADVADAHLKDIHAEARFGVRYVTYWFDYDRQTAFCLADGPNRESVTAVHRASHGLVAHEIIEVDARNVEQFMGPVREHPPGDAYIDAAFRTIMFTDIEGSTDITRRLGDRGAMEVLRVHDRIVRSALAANGGTEVKHTGDGVLGTFGSVGSAIAAAVEIQRQLSAHNEATIEPLRVRIGISAGEPVAENRDLFGAVVQLASRLCERAQPGTILVTSAVRDLAIGKDFLFERRRTLRLKGFEEAVRVFEVTA